MCACILVCSVFFVCYCVNCVLCLWLPLRRNKDIQCARRPDPTPWCRRPDCKKQVTAGTNRSVALSLIHLNEHCDRSGELITMKYSVILRAARYISNVSCCPPCLSVGPSVTLVGWIEIMRVGILLMVS